ncbi:MAG TPA: adenosylcobinamide-GDP ribazoletransferase [Burkholderiaceae bacterium]|nr:adenosylcobinamide-GDP ribazoletransferase [Burkholderiaceae bacterium]
MSVGGAIKQQLRLFFIALQFFTRLPIPRWVGFEEAWLQQAIRYFPCIGLIVAMVTWVVYWLAGLVWPPLIVILLSVSSGILLTGAFHEDGFADVCDGFGGGTSAERVLEIMKDSRIGAYGAIGIALLLALKCATLVSLPSHLMPAALLLAHTMSRLFASSLIWCLDYVRVEGKAKPLAKQMTNGEFSFAALTAIAPALALILAGWISWEKMVAGAVLAALVTGYLARLFLRRIGGYTGDCLGAVQQAAEVALYLGFLAR